MHTHLYILLYILSFTYYVYGAQELIPDNRSPLAQTISTSIAPALNTSTSIADQPSHQHNLQQQAALEKAKQRKKTHNPAFFTFAPRHVNKSTQRALCKQKRVAQRARAQQTAENQAEHTEHSLPVAPRNQNQISSPKGESIPPSPRKKTKPLLGCIAVSPKASSSVPDTLPETQQIPELALSQPYLNHAQPAQNQPLFHPIQALTLVHKLQCISRITPTDMRAILWPENTVVDKLTLSEKITLIARLASLHTSTHHNQQSDAQNTRNTHADLLPIPLSITPTASPIPAQTAVHAHSPMQPLVPSWIHTVMTQASHLFDMCTVHSLSNPFHSSDTTQTAAPPQPCHTAHKALRRQLTPYYPSRQKSISQKQISSSHTSLTPAPSSPFNNTTPESSSTSSESPFPLLMITPSAHTPSPSEAQSDTQTQLPLVPRADMPTPCELL